MNNVITKYYIHGAGLMAMVTPANEVYTYHYNAVGSTVAMSDSSQTIVNKYSYDPFGNILNQQETINQPFKFVGQHGVMTEPNGFYYMRARYYDPNVGRFISEDPIGFEGGDVNLMAYASNNPILLIDPSGLVNWKRMFMGAVETAGGIAGIGFAATTTGATGGVGALATAGLAISGSAAIAHGTIEMIAGAFETSSNPIPKIPSTSAASLGALVVTGNVNTAEKVDLISNLLLFGKTVATAGVGNKSLWEGIGAATDFISLTNQLTSSSCGRKCGQ
ncbi:MAG: RHS repeat-associated core domain-containing protein [Nitrospirae bacterium]|nr:RHS repeat-associated core domain-containing protein [Nitrospirota bacterium]